MDDKLIILENDIKTESETVFKNMNREWNMGFNNDYQSLYHHQWCPIIRFQNQCISTNVNSDDEQNSMIVSNFNSNIATIPYSSITGEIMRWPSIPFMTSMPPMYSTHSNDIIQLESKSSFNEVKQYEKMVAKRYSCSLCADSYETNDFEEFRAHVNIHSGECKPFDCQICGKQFKFRSLWRNHIISHMTVRNYSFKQTTALPLPQNFNSKPNTMFNCDQCQYYCKERSKMDRHKRMHSGMKPFKCPSCEYKSYDKTKIRRHYVTHTREKPFCCEKCKSRFTQSGSLKGHLSRVHGMVKVILNCAYCQSFSASNFGELRTHIKQMHENASFSYAIAN